MHNYRLEHYDVESAHSTASIKWCECGKFEVIHTSMVSLYDGVKTPVLRSAPFSYRASVGKTSGLSATLQKNTWAVHCLVAANRYMS